MITIKEILNYGGACPFQIDALTDDDRIVYGRYRWGTIQVRIGEPGDHSEFAGVQGESILREQIGGEYDGCMSLEEFKQASKHKINWPL